jgi:hypothetical protein
MIKGTYIVYEDGKEIARSSNIITKFGKRFTTNFLAGNVVGNSRDIAVGIGSGKTLSSISGSGSAITYTTSSDHGLEAGDRVSVYGSNIAGYNLKNVAVATAPTTTTFTVTNSATGSYTSGGKLISDIDSRLEFEFYRLPVLFGSTDIQTTSNITTYVVVYKTTLPQDVSGVISEIGFYPSNRISTNNFDSKFLADFTDPLDWFAADGSTGVESTTGAKIGSTTVTLSSASTSAREYFYTIPATDFSGYSVYDSIKLAYNKNNADLQSIKIRFYSSDSDYYEATITDTSGTGYKISSDILMSTVYSGGSGTPDKTKINKIGIVITPKTSLSTTVNFDGLRINDEDSFDPYFGLISRTLFDTSLTKQAGRKVDVEYRMEIGF